MLLGHFNEHKAHETIVKLFSLPGDIIKELLKDSLTDADKKLIERIKAISSDILSQYEKDNKIMEIYQSYVNYMTPDERDEFEDQVELLLKEKIEEYEYLEFTVINKIEVDNGDIDIAANGKDKAIPIIVPINETITNSIINKRIIWKVSAPLSLNSATSFSRDFMTMLVVKIVIIIPISITGIKKTIEKVAREYAEINDSNGASKI